MGGGGGEGRGGLDLGRVGEAYVAGVPPFFLFRKGEKNGASFLNYAQLWLVSCIGAVHVPRPRPPHPKILVHGHALLSKILDRGPV